MKSKIQMLLIAIVAFTLGWVFGKRDAALIVRGTPTVQVDPKAVAPNDQISPASIVEKKAFSNTPDGKPQLFGRDLHITSQVADAVGLSPEELMQVDLKFGNLWRNLGDLVVKNAKNDPLRSNAEKNIQAYRIVPFSGQADALMSEFRSWLVAQLGRDRGAKIAEFIPSSNYFCDFGKHELFVQFSEYKSGSGETKIRFESEERDALTGVMVSGSSGPYEAFDQLYGAGFKIVEER